MRTSRKAPAQNIRQQSTLHVYGGAMEQLARIERNIRVAGGTPLDMAAMTDDQAVAWAKRIVEKLETKKLRELNYLQRRAARGTHTPTDDAYEEDQITLAQVIATLNHAIHLQEVNI